MSEIRCYCLFLLVHILAVSGTGIASTYVCPGDSVQVFKVANFDSCNAVISLFVNGDRNTQIAKWTLQNCTLNSSLLPEYQDRLYFNTNGTILIHDVHPWDEGRYIMTKEDTFPMTYEEQIDVMALPTKDCRPTIVQLGNSLSASLNHDVCGKPLATQYWKGCCGVSNSNESVLKLSPGKDACTCYACIVSPALICARNSTPLDYCSTFIIGGTNTPPVPLETLEVKMVVFVAVGILLVIVFLLVITVFAILKRRRRNAKEWRRHKESKHSVIELDASEATPLTKETEGIIHSTTTALSRTEDTEVIELDASEATPLTEDTEDAKEWQRHKESKHSVIELDASEATPLTEDTEGIIHSTTTALIRKEDTEVIELSASEATPLTDDTEGIIHSTTTALSRKEDTEDQKRRTEEASTKIQRSQNSELERDKGPDVDRCAICGKANVSMFLLPCDHLGRWYRPTCAKCGFASKTCELCSPSNKKYMEYATWEVLRDCTNLNMLLN